MTPTSELRLRHRSLVFVPVAIVAALAVVFLIGLSGKPNELPSALIGKPVPQFSLAPILGLDVRGFSSDDLKQGGVSVVNIWASWCGPCRYEHPLLMAMSKRDDIRLIGINNKDTPENAKRFLGTLGQPFAAIGADDSGRVTIDWGGYGVPETFVVDGSGIIRFKWVGPLTPEAVSQTLSAEIEKAKRPL